MTDYQRAQKLLGPWSQALALKERVEKEAQVAWALKEVEPFEVVPPLPDSKWEPVSLHVLARGMFKQIRSVMP